jgi:hypothetical protein
MNRAITSKIAFFGISTVAIIVVSSLVLFGGSVFTPKPNEFSQPNSVDLEQINPVAYNNDYCLNFETNGYNPLIIKTGDVFRIQCQVREWAEGQDKTEKPAGAKLVNVPIEVTTNLGYFSTNNMAKIQGKTNEDGAFIVGLVGGDVKGVALVTAKLLDNSGLAASIPVFITKVEISPLEAVVNKAELLTFQASVIGIDDQDLVSYKWRNFNVSSYLMPLDSDYCYRNQVSTPCKSATLKWQRDGGGFEKDGYLEVEAVLKIPAYKQEVSLGTARAQIHTNEYLLDCELVGRVIRTESSTGVRYGVLIPKVDNVVGYGVRGYGFNDTLYYGIDYGSGFVRVETLDEEEGGYFLSITSSGGSGNSELSDEELIAKVAKRFEGGIFYASPSFGPIK